MEVAIQTEETQHKLPDTARVRQWMSRIALIVMGVAFAVILVEGAFRLFPSLRPGGRVRSVNMGLIRFTTGMGDIFYARPGAVEPPADPYKVLSEHPLAWDADGFRVPVRPSAHYEIIALGDSYTEAGNVARPWPDVLAAKSGRAVRNMGFRGYGPLEEARILKEYGAKSGARIVIVGYFEGNDLNDVISSSDDPFILPRIARQAIAPYDPNNPIWQSDKSGPFQYPLQVKINDVTQEMAFLDDYLSWLNGEYSDFARSQNLAQLGNVWDDMAKSVPNTCLVVAYFPSAPHIYAPYVIPQDRDRLISTLAEMKIAEDGARLGSVKASPSLTFADVIRRLDNQRNAVTALAAKKGLPFIDLVPAFQTAAARGEILYYTYDTHWNQAGHDLAGQFIADYLAKNPNMCGNTALISK
jgi:hypothetical protein